MDQAIQDLLYLGRRLQGVISLVPLLEDLSSLENRINERKDVINRLLVEQNVASNTLEATKRELAEVQDIYATTVEKTQAEVRLLILDAEADADSIIKNAESNVKTIKADFENQILDFKAEVQRLTDTKNLFQSDINDLVIKKNTILKEIEDLRAKF